MLICCHDTSYKPLLLLKKIPFLGHSHASKYFPRFYVCWLMPHHVCQFLGHLIPTFSIMFCMTMKRSLHLLGTIYLNSL